MPDDLLQFEPFYVSPQQKIFLFEGDCCDFLPVLREYSNCRFHAIFADPPYFLSGGGTTCYAGKRIKVDKAKWDASKSLREIHAFNLTWLKACQDVLLPNGTIWVTGTHHIIFSIGYAMQQLGFKILNSIAWEKPNPPPNLSCRYFTHSTETIIWAAKDIGSRHCFNYQAMRKENQGRQMKTVWEISAPGKKEKLQGKYSTQKPVVLVERCLRASTEPGNRILDPFLGSGTTAIACSRLGLDCVGVERELDCLNLALKRIKAESPQGAI